MEPCFRLWMTSSKHTVPARRPPSWKMRHALRPILHPVAIWEALQMHQSLQLLAEEQLCLQGHHWSQPSENTPICADRITAAATAGGHFTFYTVDTCSSVLSILLLEHTCQTFPTGFILLYTVTHLFIYPWVGGSAEACVHACCRLFKRDGSWKTTTTKLSWLLVFTLL